MRALSTPNSLTPGPPGSFSTLLLAAALLAPLLAPTAAARGAGPEAPVHHPQELVHYYVDSGCSDQARRGREGKIDKMRQLGYRIIEIELERDGDRASIYPGTVQKPDGGARPAPAGSV